MADSIQFGYHQSAIDIPSENFGRGISIVLLAFGAISLFVLGFVFEVPLFSLDAENPIGLIAPGIGVFLLLLATFFFFKKSGYQVDPDTRTIRQYSSGLFGRSFTTEIPFENVDHILVYKEVIETRSSNSSGKSKRTYYPIDLKFKDGDSKRLSRRGKYLPARRDGESFAKVLNVNLHDDSVEGSTRVRKPDELDKTVIEKLKEAQEPLKQPSTPGYMHALIQRDLDKVSIVIPPINRKALGPLMKIFWITFSIFFGAVALSIYYMIPPVFLFCGLVCLALLFLLFWSESVRLTPSTLVIRRGIFFLKRKHVIPLNELEELYKVNVTDSESDEIDQMLQSGEVKYDMAAGLHRFNGLGSAIVARSDRCSVTIGRILTAEELDVVLYELQSQLLRY